MSIDRADCEHGHGRLVNELAAMIASDHGLSIKGAVLVILPAPGGDPASLDWAGRVFGYFNTAGLAQAADAVLDQGEEHVADGCKTCDAAGKAMGMARRYFRDVYRYLVEGWRRGPSDAFEHYLADPLLAPIWAAFKLTNSDDRAKRLAKDAFMRGAAWAAAEAHNRKAKP